MERAAKPVANPIVVLREEFDDWAILFNPDTADAVGINPVGVEIWKRLDGRRNLAQVVQTVRDLFADVPDTVSDDVAAFVSQLSEHGFVGYELKSGA